MSTRDPEYKMSKKIIAYYENFVTEKVLIPKNIILSGKWDVWLMYMLVPEGRYSTGKVAMPMKPQTTASANARCYPVQVPLSLVKDAENVPLAMAQFLNEGIRLFFVDNYKKIDVAFMENVLADINMEYLISISYPPPPRDEYKLT